jgi:chromosomal replication initiator protein
MELSIPEKNIWDAVLSSVSKKLNRQIFDTWFKPIYFESCDHDRRVLSLRTNRINFDWVNTYYDEVIKSSLHEIDLDSYQIAWVIEDPKPQGGQTEKLAEKDDDDEFYFQPNTSNESLAFSAASEKASSGAARRAQYQDKIVPDSSLNPRYTFDSFVVGSCNQFAHAAAEAAVEAPGKTYNPLYIYGGVGLGKTHLMHAIGHSVKKLAPHTRVAYLTSESFMNELINAIRFDKTQAFRDRYRSIDVLLIDDVQFIAGKERTQEEFFHTFNALHNDQKQIVISSDCPPRDIPDLEERLHSRFEWGLIADIEPPDLETKVAILKRKADREGMELPDDVTMFIAGKVKNNIRELEGSLVRLKAMASLRGLPISKMLAQDALRAIIDNNGGSGITIERIQKLVAIRHRLTVDELRSKNNSRSIALPRQIAMYLCKRLTKHSFPEIGKEFGGKHHTTVIHSYGKINELLKEDKEMHRQISDLIDELCG